MYTQKNEGETETVCICLIKMAIVLEKKRVKCSVHLNVYYNFFSWQYFYGRYRFYVSYLYTSVDRVEHQLTDQLIVIVEKKKVKDLHTKIIIS